MADYKKEIEEIFKKVYLSLDADPEYTLDLFISDMLEGTGITYEKMSEEIEIGIGNGYTLQFQLALMELFLTK